MKYTSKLVKNSAFIGAISMLGGCSAGTQAHTESSPITLKEGVLLLAQKPIPSGCFAQLMTELNGDDVQAAIFLTDAAWTGCMDANETFIGETQTQYRVLETLSNTEYVIKACQSVDGSMGGYCDSFRIAFEQWPYQDQFMQKSVWVIRKTGSL